MKYKDGDTGQTSAAATFMAECWGFERPSRR